MSIVGSRYSNTVNFVSLIFQLSTKLNECLTTWFNKMVTFQGLVVPVLRDVEKMNYAEIEKAINAVGEKVSFHSSNETRHQLSPVTLFRYAALCTVGQLARKIS